MKRLMLIFFFLLVFMMIDHPAIAQRGCIASGIPFQIDGTMYTTYNSAGYYDLYGTKVTNPYQIYCIVETGLGCMIRGIFTTYYGIEVSFGPLPCPIDSHIYAIFVCIFLFGVFKLHQHRK